ncbi:hypothetical protein F5884DRAFT_884042 [Xylogone sp. PMI_703]|nr:hypothetical protein F5884DRAFT_884042 [Xylogone sp. PMI_703]
MSAAPIILIDGAGPNIGQSIGRAFAVKGYKVALAFWSAKDAQNTADQVHIAADFSDSNGVVSAFANPDSGAATLNPLNDPLNDPLALPLADFNKDFQINTISRFVAAQQAVQGFAQLPASASRTFIYTRNIPNTTIIPPLMDLGVGKSATAHLIQNAANGYKDRGYKADDCLCNSIMACPVCVELAEGKTQGPWQQTFVKGVGYKQF